jgi:hypothetical protein
VKAESSVAVSAVATLKESPNDNKKSRDGFIYGDNSIFP